MSSTGKETFTSRFGLIAATLGMAIGAGNIWRFPRIAGEYGGAFLIPWLLFLFLWSMPLLMVEFSLGKTYRLGVLAAFKKALGERFTWVGWFVAFCTSAIMFYYSVVSGWSLKYALLALSGNLVSLPDSAVYWQNFTGGMEPLYYHLVALFMAGVIIYSGVVKGIERFSKVIIPLLYILLLVSAVKAVSLNGASTGLSYLFAFEPAALLNYKVWLEGLSQSAWSTGAGWGLILTYAIYARSRENVTQNVFITGIGNNLASILAALAIIPTVFALSATVADATTALEAGNQGLAFIVIPQLFAHMPGGVVFAAVFFLALFFAALSSLLAMLELATRLLIDFGMSRRKAVLIIVALTAVAGAPSALSLDVFNNQDWVWGVGLMVSGFFFTLVAIKMGVDFFMPQWFPGRSRKGWLAVALKVLFYVVLPLEFVAMLAWWLYQSTTWDTHIWSLSNIYSLGNTFLQWGIILLLGLVFNKVMNKKLQAEN
ncbi:MAG TPA: sodium-dependent transporter [Caldithrix abyssi]|uniref:Sodium-dependent transporter n=1 Tax=Caldithrix abyssi TaxID=187145 RepID=A0A7V1LJU1_CALAY|nr:sodium-dependent transporter [Caldithrix abyssi]